MLHLCKDISFRFALAKNYIIKNLQYLIEAPPTRPANAYSRFVTQRLKGQVGISVTKIAPVLAIEWKHIEAEKKVSLENQYKAEKVTYQKLKAEYDQKYVLPFKRPSFHNLLVKHLYDSKQIQVPAGSSIIDYGKQTMKKMKTFTPEQIAQFKELANKTNEEKKKITDKYKFPQRVFFSQAGYTRAHPSTPMHQRAGAYEAYEARWQGQVELWLKANNIDLPIETFMRKYKAQLKKEKQEKIAKKILKEYGDEEPPKQKKKPARTLTGALRVKKIVAKNP